MFTASQLEASLVAAGIAIDQGSTTNLEMQIEGQKINRSTRTLIYEHQSEPLSTLVRWANKKSINLYCEAFLKAIAVKHDKPGGTVHALKIVERMWKNRRINLAGYRQEDGSGLSPRNSISTSTLSGILAAMSREKEFPTFDNSLSIAGDGSDIGSLRGSLKGTAAANNLRAKSGFITGVRSFSGYVETRSGQLLSFSIIANNYTCGNGVVKGNMMKVLKTLAEID